MKKIIYILLFCLIAVIGLFVYIKLSARKENAFQIIFFNIGQGDSALIKFDDGEKMLVDCGPDKTVLSKLGKFLSFYDRTIDYLVISHFDLDHYGGCLDVLRRYDVKNIITNGSEKEYDSYWQAWDEASKAEQANVFSFISPRTQVIAGATLDFLNPDAELVFANAKDKIDSNNQSIVFKLSYSSTTVLFAGDMEMPLENALLAKFCSSTPLNCPALRADILKVGHHGSDSSSDEKFLSAVSPKKAVVSVGKNSFGHPSLRVLRKLERINADILRTDVVGDITMH
jgi:competence protein ComEC